MNYWLGIDPGASSGAWAVIDEQTRVVETGLFSDYSKIFSCPPITLACLERVHSMPQQGVTSVFSFGENLGFWKGLLMARGIPYVNPTPQTWQGAVLDAIPSPTPRVKGETSHEASRRKANNTKILKECITGFARRIFPEAIPVLMLKKNQGIADALCMALFAKKGVV